MVRLKQPAVSKQTQLLSIWVTVNSYLLKPLSAWLGEAGKNIINHPVLLSGSFCYYCWRVLEVDFVLWSRSWLVVSKANKKTAEILGNKVIVMFVSARNYVVMSCWNDCYARQKYSRLLARPKQLGLAYMLTLKMCNWYIGEIFCGKYEHPIPKHAYHAAIVSDFFRGGGEMLLELTVNLWFVSWWGFCCSLNHFFLWKTA